MLYDNIWDTNTMPYIYNFVISVLIHVPLEQHIVQLAGKYIAQYKF